MKKLIMYSSEYFEEDTRIKNEIKTEDIDEREDKVTLVINVASNFHKNPV